MAQRQRRAGARTIVRMVVSLLISLAALAATAAGASAKLTAHGQLLKLGPLHANTNTSNNWFGYNQGTLEQNGKLFNSITGDWTVPTATQHTTGQSEASSDWIGIGGGCVDAGCTTTNPAFTKATTNGAPANLQPSEAMDLVDSSGKVIGAPSAPNATHDGFSACTWATTCP